MTGRSRLAVRQKYENYSKKYGHFYDWDREHPHLSSVSFIRVVPRVEKTIKDILSCGLERERNSIRADRKAMVPPSLPGFLPALPLTSPLPKLRNYNPRGFHSWWCKYLASSKLEAVD